MIPWFLAVRLELFLEDILDATKVGRSKLVFKEAVVLWIKQSKAYASI